MLFMIVGAVAVIRGLFAMLPALGLLYVEPTDPELAAQLILDGAPWLLAGIAIIACAAILRRGKGKKTPGE